MIDTTALAKAAAEAALELAAYTSEDKNKILSAMADAVLASSTEILAENAKDVAAMENSDPVFVDRLTLNDARIAAMVEGVKEIIALPDPVGEVTESWTRPNGMRIQKTRCPLGVVAIIYEARPNVTVDAAALCIKSGNAVILRGSKGAINSNRALYKALSDAINAAGYDSGIIQFVDDVDRESTKRLLVEEKYVDVVIPRGGEGLKHFILDNSKIPVIASAGGNCHVYVEKTADLAMAVNITVNAKCQRPSVCNAAESLLIDKEVASEYLPVILTELTKRGVEIRGDEAVSRAYNDALPATDEDYATEFHDLVMSVKVVDGIDEAIEHINRYGTKHSEAIITKSDAAAKKFTSKVDAAAVYVNVSTRFTDGFEFGFGAEMGISTGKLHARGPLGLKQLTTEKYIVGGNGQIRG